MKLPTDKAKKPPLFYGGFLWVLSQNNENDGVRTPPFFILSRNLG
jgi:hypothetical protein